MRPKAQWFGEGGLRKSSKVVSLEGTGGSFTSRPSEKPFGTKSPILRLPVLTYQHKHMTPRISLFSRISTNTWHHVSASSHVSAQTNNIINRQVENPEYPTRHHVLEQPVRVHSWRITRQFSECCYRPGRLCAPPRAVCTVHSRDGYPERPDILETRGGKKCTCLCNGV